jgi:hypothetical protein
MLLTRDCAWVPQGDKERAADLPIGPVNDRTKQTPRVSAPGVVVHCSRAASRAPRQCKMQAGFIHGLILPLYTALSTLPGIELSEVMTQLQANVTRWQNEIKALPPPPPAAAPAAAAAAPAAAGTPKT